MVVALSFRAAQSKEAGIRTLVALDDQGGEFRLSSLKWCQVWWRKQYFSYYHQTDYPVTMILIIYVCGISDRAKD
jgi:hypothetical protein